MTWLLRLLLLPLSLFLFSTLRLATVATATSITVTALFLTMTCYHHNLLMFAKIGCCCYFRWYNLVAIAISILWLLSTPVDIDISITVAVCCFFLTTMTCYHPKLVAIANNLLAVGCNCYC